MTYNCSNCGKEIGGKNYGISMGKFGEALCWGCQEDRGLSEDESNFNKDMIKGRIAEALIEQLFLSQGYEVYRYGMENTVPGITRKLQSVEGGVSNKIRKMPDFVVQKPDNRDELFFIEVKFRRSEKFSIDDVSEDFPFENCYFVIVSKKRIKCITYKELEVGEEITPKSFNYLGYRDEFDLDKDAVKEFCKFAIKFFQEV